MGGKREGEVCSAVSWRGGGGVMGGGGLTSILGLRSGG